MSAKRRSQSLDARAVQPARPIDSPYMTSEECCVYLRLDTLDAPLSALYRLVGEHKLPYGRRGNLYLFDKREVDAWVKQFSSAIEMVRSKRSA